MQSEAIRGAAAYSTPTSPAFCHMASLMAGSWSIRVYANQSRPHRQSSPSPDEGCNQRQSEAIRGNQRQLDAIRCNQMQSEPEPFGQRIGGRQSEALRGTPRQSVAIREQSESNQRHSEALRGTPRAISGRYLRSSAVISRHQPSSAVISGRYLRSAHRRRVAASDAASSRKPITAASRHPPEEPQYDRHTCHREQSEAIRGNQR